MPLYTLRSLLAATLMITSYSGFAQYHQLQLPSSSPKIRECQQLGITEICIEYSSPAVNSRTIWGNLVPYYTGGDVPWRAGANMATRISFSDTVKLNGHILPAGSYSIHFLPTADNWTLIISGNDNLWGSYYYDATEDVLRTELTPEAIPHHERLRYEFQNRTKTTIDIALQWAQLRIPFTLEVDVHKTVLQSFKAQLRGHHANSWGAWYSAAAYCSRNQVALDQGLKWIDRAIAGGYNGYRAAQNFRTYYLKYQILQQMGQTNQAQDLLTKAIAMIRSKDDYEDYAIHQYRQKDYQAALTTLDQAIALYPDYNGNYLVRTRCLVALEELDQARESAKKALEYTPIHYKAYIRNFLNSNMGLNL